MAKQLEKWDWRVTGRPSLYPWDAYLDGAIWHLQNGEDFKITPKSMQNLILKAAKARGLKPRMEVQNDGSIVLQAGPRMPMRRRRTKAEMEAARIEESRNIPDLEGIL